MIFTHRDIFLIQPSKHRQKNTKTSKHLKAELICQRVPLVYLTPGNAGFEMKETEVQKHFLKRYLTFSNGLVFQFGRVRTDPVSHIYDLYRVHKCSSDLCKQVSRDLSTYGVGLDSYRVCVCCRL